MFWSRKPSRVLTSGDVERAEKLCEFAKLMLKTMAYSFVLKHADKPVLEFCSSDCTPLMTSAQHKRSWQDFTVTPRGKLGKDYLIRRLLYQAAFGESTMLCTEPAVLASKSAMCHLRRSDLYVLYCVRLATNPWG